MGYLLPENWVVELIVVHEYVAERIFDQVHCERRREHDCARNTRTPKAEGLFPNAGAETLDADAHDDHSVINQSWFLRTS